MKNRIYQVDAFTDKVFSGNPAGVCPLEQWLPDDILQKIAMENNLSETAFYVKKGDHYELRWFTPTVEVDLCGHATLASAYVLFNYEGHNGNIITFDSPRSGLLRAKKDGDLITLDFPTDVYRKIDLFPALVAGFRETPVEAYQGKTDYLVVFENEEQIRNMVPDFGVIGKLPVRGVIATARGIECDFVSRFFGPQSGVDEDPVTGSAHTTLTPYWAGVLGKTTLSAIQLSSRRGYLQCRLLGDRVEISGKARIFFSGTLSESVITGK
jgi:PhzF family phenazine biosynthesis protein